QGKRIALAAPPDRNSTEAPQPARLCGARADRSACGVPAARARVSLPSPSGICAPPCFAIQKPQIPLSYMLKTGSRPARYRWYLCQSALSAAALQLRLRQFDPTEFLPGGKSCPHFVSPRDGIPRPSGRFCNMLKTGMLKFGSEVVSLPGGERLAIT